MLKIKQAIKRDLHALWGQRWDMLAGGALAWLGWRVMLWIGG
jgi:hypothetical protein